MTTVAGPRKDARSPVSVAMQWVGQITTIGFEMVLPAGLGYWLDGKWGTAPWLLVTGALMGAAVAFLHLLQIAAAAAKAPQSNDKNSTR